VKDSASLCGGKQQLMATWSQSGMMAKGSSSVILAEAPSGGDVSDSDSLWRFIRVVISGALDDC
jgi:hypothetical protein